VNIGSNKKKFIVISAITGLIACEGDFIFMYLLGLHYPEYSQLTNTMSSLGASNSPVSQVMSLWWIIMGIMFIIFAIGFRYSYSKEGKYAKIISWLLILYGLGEGMGSGIFKADHIDNSLTTSGIIHNIVGGIGVASLIVLPYIGQKIFTKGKNPFLNLISWIVLLLGIIFLVLFSFRISNLKDNILVKYQGLWQRLFILDYYIYFSIIAIQMIKKSFSEKRKLFNPSSN
jgi:hypothetical membrane protein